MKKATKQQLTDYFGSIAVNNIEKDTDGYYNRNNIRIWLEQWLRPQRATEQLRRFFGWIETNNQLKRK